MAEKNYCIIQSGDAYYVPIKAEFNPYPGHESEKAYLACLPNFFGGARERGENFYEGIAREVREESAGKINISTAVYERGQWKRLYQYRQYTFYLVTLSDRVEYFGGNLCDLSGMAEKPAEKEMSCILKIPVDNDLRGKSFDSFLERCKQIGGDFVNINPRNPDGSDNNSLTQWKTHEGTKDAFKELLGLQ